MLPQVVSLPDIEATGKLAARLAPLLQSGDVVALQGDLGTGKTTFARLLLHALKVAGDIPSPTFTLLQTYEAGHATIHHLDLYRLKDAAELDELGWDDLIAEGISVIEWPEHAKGYMPKDYLALHFSLSEEKERSCLLVPHGAWGDRVKGA